MTDTELQTKLEITFKNEKLGSELRLAKDFVNQADIHVINDYVTNAFFFHMQGYLFTHSRGKQTVTVYRKRPTFLQWLLRKPIQIEVEIECKEMFKNPPIVKGNEHIYIAKQV